MTFSQILVLAGMFIIPFTIAAVPMFIGQQMGILQARNKKQMDPVPMESVVAASFGLVAFMLAFTFQIAATRWEARRALLYSEVQEIRTTFLRAGLIPEPYNSNTKRNLIEYVNLRVGVLDDESRLNNAIARSQIILDTLWKYTEALAIQDRSSEVYSLYTTSINQMVDVYNERITMSLVYRIPPTVIYILTIVVILAMLLLGYHFGLNGRGNNGVKLLLAILFSVVMFLILVLDRPESGVMKLNQKPILNLQKQLNEKHFIPAGAGEN